MKMYFNDERDEFIRKHGRNYDAHLIEKGGVPFPTKKDDGFFISDRLTGKHGQ